MIADGLSLSTFRITFCSNSRCSWKTIGTEKNRNSASCSNISKYGCAYHCLPTKPVWHRLGFDQNIRLSLWHDATCFLELKWYAYTRCNILPSALLNITTDLRSFRWNDQRKLLRTKYFNAYEKLLRAKYFNVFHPKLVTCPYLYNAKYEDNVAPLDRLY